MSMRRRTSRVIPAALALLVACGAPREQVPAASARTAQYPTATLDQMLAPIALYPDQLLAQMLISAADAANVTKLDAWLKTNQALKGTQLQDAAVKAGFEPSFVALTLFPQVVTKMAEQIAWTTVLGQSFTADRSAVFASIQRLRLQAKSVGTLKSTPQQQVDTKKTSTGEDVIVIEPANPQIVYVPQYNTQVVYTQAPSTTTVIVEQDNGADVAVAAGLIGFTAGIAIGASMNNNYYYGPYGWRGGAYMYNDAWNDYYDHREDAREDWMDHREDLMDERGDRAENRSDQRTDRAQSTQAQRTDRQQTRQENRPASQVSRTGGSTQERSAPARTAQTSSAPARTAQTNSAPARTTTADTQRANRTGSPEARGYSDGGRPEAGSQRSGGGSDAFSGYSSGASQRSASSRGQQSRSSSRGGGGGGRRR
jgi:hypothetical protein